ncbi:MAG: trypsin-like peptidase domain-containing protein [Ferruginibacter sp.]
MKLKHILFTALISALTSAALVIGMGNYFKKDNSYAGQKANVVPSNYKLAGLTEGGAPNGIVPDFVQSAEVATPTVVHIKTKTNAKQVNNNLPRARPNNPFSDLLDDDMYNQLFGGRSNMIPEQRASGSGVIISDNGYIVTNNHVINKADEINVTLSNKKSYKATLVGSDPAYDLAVIKIESEALPYLLYGNSDDVKIGQWVMAIGYPLNLETTVTAGIVSAKARSLGLNRDKAGSTATAVESFIQTDAAVNSGNSGGALINTEGKLIGINSAIASPTGYYSGYSYAIPVNIVKKVVDDIIKFGTVQRAYLGISYDNASGMSEEEKKSRGIPTGIAGIYIQETVVGGAAAIAGLKKGDVVKAINGVNVSSGAELQEQVSRYKPGDKITVTYERNNKALTIPVSLTNKSNNFDLVKEETNVADILGADFITIDAKNAKNYGIPGGVIVKKIKPGGVLNDQTRMRDNFVILKVNDRNINNMEELQKAISGKSSFTVSGFYPGYDGVYEYPISMDGSDE